MLWSGGIGDFFQYASFLPAFLDERGIAEDRLELFIEATNPDNVRALFDAMLPVTQVTFVPREIHWTRVNPLIDPRNDRDRINRPAYRWLSTKRTQFVDWFLPHCCKPRLRTTEIISRVPREPWDAAFGVAVSLRNKGALWWPDAELLTCLQAALPDAEFRFYGEPNEALPGYDVGKSSLMEALASVLAADLYVGTDTGLATIRELTGKTNIYCLADYWLQDMLLDMDYLTTDILQKSGSIVANSSDQLISSLNDVVNGLGYQPEQQIA